MRMVPTTDVAATAPLRPPIRASEINASSVSLTLRRAEARVRPRSQSRFSERSVTEIALFVIR